MHATPESAPSPHEAPAGYRGGHVLAYSWLVVLALATTGGYVREPLSGQLLLNVLVAISILVAGTGWLLVWRHEGSAHLKGLWFLGAWLAVALAGLIWVPDKSMAIRYIVYMIVRLALIVLTAFYLVRQKNGRFATAICYLAAAVVAVNVGLAAWEHLTQSHFHLSATLTMAPHKQGWPSGLLTNPNDMCLLLALYLPFITAWPRQRRTALREALAISAFVIVTWVAIAAQSRALIVVLLGQLLWLATAGMRHKLLAAAGAVVVVGLLIPFVHDQWPYFVVQPVPPQVETATSADPAATEEATPTLDGGPAPVATPVVRRAQTLEEAVRAVGTEFSFGGRSGSERLQLLQIGGRLLLESRGLGVGPGNSGLLIRQVKSEGRTDLHNWWMELLVDYGVAGFLAFAGFYVWLWISVLGRWRTLPDGRERYLAEVAMVSLATFALGSIVPSSIAPHPYPWMLFGLALALVSAPGSAAFQACGRGREAPR